MYESSAHSSSTHLTALSTGSSFAHLLCRPKHDKRTFEQVEEDAKHLALPRPEPDSDKGFVEPFVVEIITPSPSCGWETQSPYAQFVLESIRRESSAISLFSSHDDQIELRTSQTKISSYGSEQCTDTQEQLEERDMHREHVPTHVEHRPRCRSFAEYLLPKDQTQPLLHRYRFSRSSASVVDKTDWYDDDSIDAEQPKRPCVIASGLRRVSEASSGKRRSVFGSLWPRRSISRSCSLSPDTC